MIIYYNATCSKCAEARSLLEANQCNLEIRDYLLDPPGIDELRELVEKLGCKPLDLIRQGEPLFIERYAGKRLSDDQWLEALAEHPILLQRPIVINGDRAIIGRPPILVLDLVKNKV